MFNNQNLKVMNKYLFKDIKEQFPKMLDYYFENDGVQRRELELSAELRKRLGHSENEVVLETLEEALTNMMNMQMTIFGYKCFEEQQADDYLTSHIRREGQVVKITERVVVYDNFHYTDVYNEGFKDEEDLEYDFEVSYAVFERQDEEGRCLESCTSVLVLPNIR